MDPRNNWTRRDWVIAEVYFNMKKRRPPGEDYILFYNYCQTHQPPSQNRILKTILEILTYKNLELTEDDLCIANKILKLWTFGYNN